jgi:hypothetical protein
MSQIRKHSDRTRTPESRRRSRDARAERRARERMANLAERAYLAIVEGQAR